MRVKTERFEAFYQTILSPMIQKTPFRIISGDGQAVRATGLSSSDDTPSQNRAYMLMNFYDSTNHVCLAQRLMPSSRHFPQAMQPRTAFVPIQRISVSMPFFSS